MKWICSEGGKREWLWKLRVLLGLGNYLLEQMGRLQEQQDNGSDLPTGMQKAMTETDLRFLTSSPPPWENTNKSLSFPMAVRLTHQLDDSSDKIFRHLFRQITTSPSKENLSWAKAPSLLQWAIPSCLGTWTLHDGCAGIRAACTTGDE